MFVYLTVVLPNIVYCWTVESVELLVHICTPGFAYFWLHTCSHRLEDPSALLQGMLSSFFF